MQRDVKEKVREWLEKDMVDLFLGYRMMDGHVLPHAFVKNRLGVSLYWIWCAMLSS